MSLCADKGREGIKGREVARQRKIQREIFNVFMLRISINDQCTQRDDNIFTRDSDRRCTIQGFSGHFTQAKCHSSRQNCVRYFSPSATLYYPIQLSPFELKVTMGCGGSKSDMGKVR